MRKNGARSSHTAHQLNRSRVFYKFHPFFDHEISAIRTLRSGGESVIVRISDNDLRIAVPAWMLDQAHCKSMVLKDEPRIQLDALRQLREIVDLHVGHLIANNMSSHSTERTGERHGQESLTDSPADT